MRKYLINQTLTFFPWRVNYIKAWAKQSSHVLRSKFPTQSTAATPWCSVTESLPTFVCFYQPQTHKYQLTHTRFFKYTHKNSLTQSHADTQVHTHRRTTARSPWLGRAICLSPPSPLTAAVCPGWLWASQKSPSVIQQHINLLKSQPFQKGRRRSYFRQLFGATSYHFLKYEVLALP